MFNYDFNTSTLSEMLHVKYRVQALVDNGMDADGEFAALLKFVTEDCERKKRTMTCGCCDNMDYCINVARDCHQWDK